MYSHMHNVSSLLIILVLLICSTNTAVDYQWSYDEIEKWGSWYPSCSGDTQSPIAVNTDDLDINCPSKVEHDTLMWNINNLNDTWRFDNNGHSLHAVPVFDFGDFGISHGFLELNSASNTIGKLKNNFVTKSGEHKLYCLNGIHFHWGLDDYSGSEHIINDIHYPLELHFVHYSCDYDSMQDALAAHPQDPYVLAVVSVLFAIGAPNEFIEGVTDSIDYVKNAHHEMVIPMLNIRDLIPTKMSEFYYYKGSLTTPGCNQVVQWHILSEQMTISHEQTQSLRTLVNAEDTSMAPNYRSIQHNKNKVYCCSSKKDKPRKRKLFIIDDGDISTKRNSNSVRNTKAWERNHV